MRRISNLSEKISFSKNRPFLEGSIFPWQEFLVSSLVFLIFSLVFLLLGQKNISLAERFNKFRLETISQEINDVSLSEIDSPCFLFPFSKTNLLVNYNGGKSGLANRCSFLPLNPLNFGQKTKNSGVFTYTVRRGDTLIKIAKRFNVSLSTILSVNKLEKDSIIRPGMKLTILPVTGILYQVKEGDTLESVALRFKISVRDLKKFNHLSEELDELPKFLIIPGILERVEWLKKETKDCKNLPDSKNYFAIPAQGVNNHFLHPVNAVDISNICGTPIYAAQEGLVIEAKAGFNRGYGNYIEIQHPNGTRTLYAHLGKLLVERGDYVRKGQIIAEMGNSGEPEKVKGCHLHFEVYGAKNFLAE